MRRLTKDIIARAKQQPRHGVDPLEVFDESLKGLNNTSNATVAGIGILASKIKDLGDEYMKVASKTNFLEQAVNGLQKSFGLNLKDATRFYGRLTEISKEFGVGASQIAVYSKNLKGLIGGFANLSGKEMNNSLKSLLQVQTIIQTNLGLTGEVANKFTMYAALQGKSADESLIQQQKIADEISKQTGMQVTLQDVLSDVTSVTEDLQLQYGRIPGALELAAVRAKTLGFSMSQLHKTGEGLLNIQSSIGDELEYQLLSGRRLIGDAKTNEKLQGKSLTNAYREATLRGEANEQMNIMNALVRQEGDTLRNNMFARQQMAKLLGTDEATIARTLAKQELLAKIGGEALLDMTAENMQKSILELPIKEEEKKAALAELAKLNDTRTPDQRAADYLQSMVSDGIKLMAGPAALSELVDAAAEGKLTGLQKIGEGTTAAFATNTEAAAQIGAASLALEEFTSVVSKVTDYWTTLVNAIKNPAGVSLFTESPITKPNDIAVETMEDGVIAPGNGKILFNGDQGAIRFGDNDYITASTNNPMGGGGGGWQAVVAAIQDQTRALSNNSSTGINPDYWT
jgi:hypothetical protein